MRHLRQVPWPLAVLVLPFFVVAATTPTPPTISLNVDHGPPGTHVSVTGSGFNANERVVILFDALAVNTAAADAQGGFTADVVVPETTQGTHTICAQQQRCANFVVTAPPRPTPPPTPEATPTPSPTETPSPSASPSASPSSTPTAIAGISTGSSGGGLLGSLFPWILVPILLLLAAGGVAVYLILRNRRGGGGPAPSPFRPARPPQPPGPGGIGPGQMTVTHRAPTPGGMSRAARPPGAPSPPNPWPGTPPPPPPPRAGPPSGGWTLPDEDEEGSQRPSG